MAIVVNLYYTGTNGAARKFAEEMVKSKTVETIAKLRTKYDLHMRVEKYRTDEEGVPERDRDINVLLGEQ